MEPFRIDVPDTVLADLRERLGRTRWPAAVEGIGWDRGTDPAFLRTLLACWADGFDRRAREAAVNELPPSSPTCSPGTSARSAPTSSGCGAPRPARAPGWGCPRTGP